MCLKVSHSELKTQFSSREMSEMVTFPGLPTKAFYSIMYLKESVSMWWEKNGIVWDRPPFPPLPKDRVCYLLWRKPPGFSEKERKHVSLWGEPIPEIIPSTAFCRVNLYPSSCITFLKWQHDASGIKYVLNFLFYYCELDGSHHSTPLLDLETRGMMIMWPQKSMSPGFIVTKGTHLPPT